MKVLTRSFGSQKFNWIRSYRLPHLNAGGNAGNDKQYKHRIY
jgi:hypothetical protein